MSAGAVSVTPKGGAIVAVLVSVPVMVALTSAVTVKVTLPLAVRLGIKMPLPCINATVVLAAVGHCELSVGLLQVTLLIVSPVTAGSVNRALETVVGPALVTLMV
ncbi:hypothetical protein D9M68_849310 [compost metagenome]